MMLTLGALVLAAGCDSKSDDTTKAPLTPQQLRGQRLYAANCAICHRADSEAPLNGPGMKGVFQKKFLPSGAPANDERVGNTIRRGRLTMPAYEEILDESQLNDLLAYLHTL